VKIRENRIVQEGTPILNNDVGKIRVLSILGKARMGKSTFLNAIVSSLTGKSVTPFQTQDDDEHCTRGVDAYFLPEASLLLLDFQGLALEDSSHDPALLLFAYRISHLLIFNERMMLQNEALKLMEPICAFMQYIDDDTPKPALYFRISDGDIVSNPTKNLEKVMATYNDQYQSIRDSIRTLFRQEIGIVKTDTLDRATKAQIQRGEYSDLLKKETFGFPETIHTILSALPNDGYVGSQWIAQIPHIIQGINENKKITIEKLDVVGQTTKIEILEWMQNLEPALFESMVVDGLQATFEAVVEPRKAMKKATLAAFTRKFKSVADALKTPYYKQLAERFQLLISAAEKESAEKAEAILKSATRLAKMDQKFVSLNSVSGTFGTIPETFWKGTYFVNYEKLRSVSATVYAPVRQMYEDWIQAQEKLVQAKLQSIILVEKTELEMIQVYVGQQVSIFETKTSEKIRSSLVPADLLKTNSEILEQFAQEFRKDVLAFAVTTIHCWRLDVEQKDGELIVQISELPALTQEAIEKYGGIREHLDSFWNSVNEFLSPSGTLATLLVQMKEGILKGKHIPLQQYQQLVKVNSDIKFVEDYVVNFRTTPYMTETTFNITYKPFYELCISRMIEKGYIREKSVSIQTKFYDSYDSYSESRTHNNGRTTVNRTIIKNNSRYVNELVINEPEPYLGLIKEQFTSIAKKEYMRLYARGEDCPELII
jgi:hypothetical protein